mmetsp:Transcript_19555/g.27122  ORF Transcript_19555/g.27122 Transcript_19555/m.27122 type:complete len:174 (+) Transcript_19555:141-662(+)
MTLTQNDDSNKASYAGGEAEIIVNAEPEIVVGYAPSAPEESQQPPIYTPGASSATTPNFSQSLNQSSTVKPATTTTTTTTYTVPPPAAPQPVAPGPMPVFGRDPTGFTCPHCHKNCVTRTRSHPDVVTIVAIILLVLFFWPLFWLPLCLPGCQTTDHYCSCCNRKVGSRGACN